MIFDAKKKSNFARFIHNHNQKKKMQKKNDVVCVSYVINVV